MTVTKENHPLLVKMIPEKSQENLEEGHENERVPLPDSTSIYLFRNFIAMAISFSVNHGCVVSCLAYSTAQLGNELGGYGSGVLYIFYAMTAFFLSKPIVYMVGSKNGLLIGVFGYCIYVCGFLLAVLLPRTLAWPIFMIACAIGGFSGGLLWPSQGRYFSRNSKLYSDATGVGVEKINATFAGIFAAAYLGIEMITKILATLIFIFYPSKAPAIIFTVYTVLAVVAVLGVSMLDDLQESASWDFSIETIVFNSGGAAKLLLEDPRLSLMIPFQISFGFASSFVPYYIFGTIIRGSQKLGSTYVGLLSAVIVFTGACMSIPSASLTNKFGKPIVMTIGGLCLASSGLALFLFSNETLGTWGFILPYLVIYGVGRGTWESTNKAVIADLYVDTPDATTAAFASISFFNGIAAATGYFSFSSMSRLAIAGLVSLTSLIGIISYLISSKIHHSKNDYQIVERLSKYNT